jgi:hypothetical protein
VTYSRKQSSGWSKETVDGQQKMDEKWADLEFTPTGTPWVTYSYEFTAPGQPRDVRIGYKNGGSWTTKEVVKLKDNRRAYTSLAINNSGDIWLAFNFQRPSEPNRDDGKYQDLAVAHRQSSNNWKTYEIDTRPYAGYRPDIAFSKNNTLNFAYLQGLDIVYGRYDTNNKKWSYRDPIKQSDLQHPNIAVTSNGSPVVSHLPYGPNQLTNLEVLQ